MHHRDGSAAGAHVSGDFGTAAAWNSGMTIAHATAATGFFHETPFTTGSESWFTSSTKGMPTEGQVITPARGGASPGLS